MGSQPQNPEFRINPENFHPCNLWTTFMDISVITVYSTSRNNKLHRYLLRHKR